MWHILCTLLQGIAAVATLLRNDGKAIVRWDISLALNMTALRFVGTYTRDDTETQPRREFFNVYTKVYYLETGRVSLSISSAIFCTGFSTAHLPQASRNVLEYLSVFLSALKNDRAVKFSSYSTVIAPLL